MCKTIASDLKKLAEVRRQLKFHERQSLCDERGEPMGSQSLGRAEEMLGALVEKGLLSREAREYLTRLNGSGRLPAVEGLEREVPTPAKPVSAMPASEALQRETTTVTVIRSRCDARHR